MIIFKARKLWQGDVSVQSFIVEYAKKMKQKIRIEYENGYMIIDGDTPYRITAPPQIARKTDKYIKKGKSYQLYDYFWQPTTIVEDSSLEGRIRMLEAWKESIKKKSVDKQEKLW